MFKKKSILIQRFILEVLLVFLVVGVYAQDEYSPALDFTLEDTQGNIVNLFDEMANDKTVILFFFSADCGNCHIEAPKVDSIYRQFGSGQNQLLVWSIAEENSSFDDVVEFIEETQITFPCFPTGHATDVFELYNIGYTPQIFIICDYYVSESISFFEIIENLDHCFPTDLTNYNIDPPIINVNNNKIVINSVTELSELNIYDITGKKVLTKSGFQTDRIEIDNLRSANLYLITFVFKNGQIYSGKIVIR